MVSTTYSKSTALQVTLPTADADKAVQQPFELNVAVDPQGNYAVNNTRVTSREATGLADEMKASLIGIAVGQKGPVVIINADATAAHQSVINVLEAARLAGFDRVTFAAQTSGKK